jgi:hypothetical protein
MDQNSLQLIINNDKGILALERFMKDCGTLHLAASQIVRSKFDEIPNQIGKLKAANHAMSESITYLASVLTTLKYNPQSPMVQ